ncbi:MAG: xanthine dehydrogenase family protein molybdopterin-binding subunit [Azospirillaceae bacterium]
MTPPDSASVRAPIGEPLPRPQSRRFLFGRGRYVDDVAVAGVAHVVYVRSPFAAADITGIDVAAAKAAPGVIAVVTGSEIAEWHDPWVATITNLPGQKSPPQHALALDRVRFQGEPVVAVVAESRAEAEDAAELVEVDYAPLEAVVDMETALDPATRVVSPELGDNLFWRMDIDPPGVSEAFARSTTVVEETFHIGRQTLAPLEPRGIVADYDPAEQRLTLTFATQVPHIMRYVFAKHLRLDEHRVRVVCPDVGGAFGLKIHTYGDEVATAILSMMLKRPLKFIADRLESFVSDVHCRDHRVKARLGLDAEGRITALEIDDLTAIGPFSVYPRSSGIEALLVCTFTGSPYHLPAFKAAGKVVFTNKNVMCQLRGVGMPIACSVGEGIIDKAARAAGIDPLDFRRRNLIPDDAYPYTTASGMPFESLSQQAALEKLAALMDYDGLRREQAELREQGVYRGIGLACFVEGTAPSPAIYGEGGAPISAQDTCTVRLEPSGALTCLVGVSEQGQGAEAVIAQVTAAAIGVAHTDIRVLMGDTDATPYGGGTWASRATAIAGEAARKAGVRLRANILGLAGQLLQARGETLDIRAGTIVDAATGEARMTLRELGHAIHFRTTEFAPDTHPEIAVTEQFSVRSRMFLYTNGAMGCHVEVDPETGFVTVLKVWCVEDCGTVVNPMLLDDQIRGGIVQGIGNTLYEELVYDGEGQLQNGSFIDYLLPMAGEMPDIEVAHIETPTAESGLGAKGAGEAGIIGAPGAVLNAINDALAPLGASVSRQPYTPERILAALGKVPSRD